MAADPFQAGDEMTPLSDDAFDRMMDGLGPFEARPRVAVAVSGGADSLCLTVLANRWAERRGGEITALTVDHGLRPEAGEETRRLGRWLDALSIDHRVLPWTGPKPLTGVQAGARRARYDLMNSWCREAGVLHLLLAHTRDDQAETLLLRLGAGSGADGLAAMSAIRETPDVRLLRPFLEVPKTVLVATLGAECQAWIEDPSNRDVKFARVRVRQAMKAADIRTEALARTAHRFGRARAALEAAASQVLACSVRMHPAGFAHLDRARLEHAPEEVSLRALSRVIAAIGGRQHGPRLVKLERLHGQMFSAAANPASPAPASPFAGTLGGCRIIFQSGSGGGKFLICREARGLPDSMSVHPGQRLAWDSRFNIRIADTKTGAQADLRLAGLGSRGWSEIVRIRPDLRAGPVPGPARDSLPALFDEDGVLAVPHLGFDRRQDIDVKNTSDSAKDPEAGPELAEIRFCPPQALSSMGFFLRSVPDILSH
ncbi:MAG: tRNA lysidine(34) synthetase TilS [Proteobacteria bacterium]|nr:tRNA lysidine(34) synthetase TilS [Pseudomonadota bacterium]